MCVCVWGGGGGGGVCDEVRWGGTGSEEVWVAGGGRGCGLMGGANSPARPG